MILAIEFEKYVASISIFSIIIDKLYHKKKQCLIILFKLNKNPKISLYCTMLSFSLAIYLSIKDNKKFLLNA